MNNNYKNYDTELFKRGFKCDFSKFDLLPDLVSNGFIIIKDVLCDSQIKEFRKNKLRNFPALVFHTYNCFVESENSIEIPFSKPTIGFHLSFPVPENIVETAEERVRLKKDIKISYALNTVAQQQEIDFEEEFDESEITEISISVDNKQFTFKSD